MTKRKKPIPIKITTIFAQADSIKDATAIVKAVASQGYSGGKQVIFTNVKTDPAVFKANNKPVESTNITSEKPPRKTPESRDLDILGRIQTIKQTSIYRDSTVSKENHRYDKLGKEAYTEEVKQDMYRSGYDLHTGNWRVNINYGK